MVLPRIGRILSDAERTTRLANEAAASLPGENLRTAFAISNRHVLTAWHCVRDDFRSGEPLWYRVRAKGSRRLYVYIPVRVSNYDEPFDAAALTVDNDRLSDVELTLPDAERHLADVAVPLAGNVSNGDNVVLVGFPSSGSAADSDTNDGRIVDSDLALGEVVGIKIQSEAFGAVSPVDPHGLSGGPVLREVTVGDERDYAAVGIVRAAPRGIVSYASAGASVVASRLSDLVGLLPEVAVALSRGTAQELATAVALSGSTEEGSERSAGLDPKQSFLSISQECLKTLAEKAVRILDSSRGELTGWAHFFDEPPGHLRPTAISTAYGLKIALTIDAPDGSLDRSRLTETLWKLRLSDGGWAARTGRDYSRPETTALVLGALASAGYDGNRLAEAGLAFEKALSRQADPVARSLVYPTCAGIRGLVRARPDSNRLPELRTSLLEGAISDSTNRDLTCWASELASSTTTTTTLLPSVPHTAMAIVSLCRANLVLGPDEKTTAALDQAVAWLSQHPDLAHKSEQIRRFIDQHDEQRDLLNVNHFTAAWVARALLSVQPISAPETEALLLNAVRQVWLAQRGGVWNWEENFRPVWMTYQGLCVLRDYSMLRGLELLTRA